MNLPKEKPDIKPLNTKEMVVTPDGTTVLVGGRRYARTVLPSVAISQPEPELEVLDEDETTSGTDTAT